MLSVWHCYQKWIILLEQQLILEKKTMTPTVVDNSHWRPERYFTGFVLVFIFVCFPKFHCNNKDGTLVSGSGGKKTKNKTKESGTRARVWSRASHSCGDTHAHTRGQVYRFCLFSVCLARYRRYEIRCNGPMKRLHVRKRRVRGRRHIKDEPARRHVSWHYKKDGGQPTWHRVYFRWFLDFLKAFRSCV